MSKEPLLSPDEILKALPHRYPFLLVDKVVEVIDNTFITAIKNVSFNEPYFQGHFPQNPIMPGVLILEALAQTCGLLIYAKNKGKQYKDFYLAGFDKSRFKRPVKPGDQLILKAELKQIKLSMWVFSTQAYVNDQMATKADIKLVIDQS